MRKGGDKILDSLKSGLLAGFEIENLGVCKYMIHYLHQASYVHIKCDQLEKFIIMKPSNFLQ